MKISNLITNSYNTFTKSEKKIADFILTKPTSAYASKLSDLAQYLNCGEATVIRFIKKCGYTSFKNFQYDLSNDLNDVIKEKTEHKYETLDNYIDEIKYLQQHISTNQIKEVAKKINDAYFVGCIGVTYSAQSAQFSNLDLRVAGINSCAYCTANSMVTIFHQSPKNSVFLIFSRLGETNEIIQAISIADRKDITIVAICGNPNSRIAKLSDIVIDCSHSEKEYDLSTSTFIIFLNQVLISRMIIQEYQNFDYNNRRKYVYDSHRSLMEIAK
ncbi:MAG: MurR/RpiR family transcriptional regulator [Erysipelotrichia bacterium]|nr:MurR/RpiR family transcriptional regulator [Erysipelotrichia bacterium]